MRAFLFAQNKSQIIADAIMLEEFNSPASLKNNKKSVKTQQRTYICKIIYINVNV